MAYTLKEIEYLHDNGRMPDWIYYQVNGKSAQENYTAIKQKQRLRLREQLLSQLQDQEDLDDGFGVVITSEVKVK